jgi:hypothetical protein
MANKYAMVWVLALLTACDAAPTYTSPNDAAVKQAADQKVQRVIAELQADCDTSLQKETYKKVQALLQSKRPKHSP